MWPFSKIRELKKRIEDLEDNIETREIISRFNSQKPKKPLTEYVFSVNDAVYRIQLDKIAIIKIEELSKDIYVIINYQKEGNVFSIKTTGNEQAKLILADISKYLQPVDFSTTEPDLKREVPYPLNVDCLDTIMKDIVKNSDKNATELSHDALLAAGWKPVNSPAQEETLMERHFRQINGNVPHIPLS